MKLIANLKISHKLIISFVLVALVAAVVGFSGYYAMTNMRRSEKEITEVSLPSVKSLLILSEAQTAIDSAENALLTKELTAEQRLELYQRIENAWSRADNAWLIYAPLPQTDEEEVLWNQFVLAWNVWKEDHQQYLKLAKDFAATGSDTLYQEMVHQALVVNGKSFTESEDILNKISDLNMQIAENESILLDQKMEFTLNKQIIIITAGFILSVVLGVVLSRLICKPLANLSLAAKKLAVGDINVDISSESKDEIGILVQDFSEMIENIRYQSNIAKQIAIGNISVEIEPKSDVDVLANSMVSVKNTLNQLVTETKMLTKAATEGNLKARGNEEIFTGSYQEIIQGFNNTLTAIVTPVNEALNSLNELAKGNLSTRVMGDYRGDFAQIKDSVNATASEIQNYIADMSHVLGEMSNSNLSVCITQNYLGDFLQLKESINHINNVFNQITIELRSSAEQVEAGAVEVANSSQNLSQGATEQAGAVEEMSATINQVAEQTKQNALNANNANSIANATKNMAEAGNEQMQRMLSSMNDINDSSKSISKIIKVIDDIAFQTNILALNAAVETARAGEHGKGFAVVAEEVRSLAARSSEAAKETTELIDNSIRQAVDGTKLANETASDLDKIVKEISEVSSIVEDIANASNEQATAISQVNDGIMQITEVTQANSATAEETASTSEEMASQAQNLKRLVGAIKIKENTIELKNEIRSHVANTPQNPASNDNLKIALDDNEFGKY